VTFTPANFMAAALLISIRVVAFRPTVPPVTLTIPGEITSSLGVMIVIPVGVITIWFVGPKPIFIAAGVISIPGAGALTPIPKRAPSGVKDNSVIAGANLCAATLANEFAVIADARAVETPTTAPVVMAPVEIIVINYFLTVAHCFIIFCLYINAR
jgi:hypothetical protein